MASIITEKTVQNIIGRRNKEIHKGDCGRVLIAAGSLGMAGAAILAARSALRAGSGLVRTAIPLSLFPVVQVGVPEATCVERVLPIQNLADFDAICVGPGLGEEKEGIDFVKKLLISYENTLLVDADGLNIIAHNDFFELLRRRAEIYPERTILTPHMGEARRLLAACQPDSPAGTPLATRTCAARLAPATTAFDFSGRASAAAREAIADALVQKTGAIIVLKGAGTLVAAPGKQTYTNTTGNPGMATAGAGDVLSGIITSLAGQRRQVGTSFAPACEPKPQRTGFALSHEPEPQASRESPAPARIGTFEAALAGVYIHGLAGDLAAEELGEYGVTAGDIVMYTAYAIKKILSEV